MEKVWFFFHFDLILPWFFTLDFFAQSSSAQWRIAPIQILLLFTSLACSDPKKLLLAKKYTEKCDKSHYCWLDLPKMSSPMKESISRFHFFEQLVVGWLLNFFFKYIHHIIAMNCENPSLDLIWPFFSLMTSKTRGKVVN